MAAILKALAELVGSVTAFYLALQTTGTLDRIWPPPTSFAPSEPTCFTDLETGEVACVMAAFALNADFIEQASPQVIAVGVAVSLALAVVVFFTIRRVLDRPRRK